jgi:hypothetical protein
MSEDPKRGYFLSAEDADQLREIGRLTGFPMEGWFEDRTRSSFVKRMDQRDDWADVAGRHHDSTYAHLRAVIENCKTATPDAIRHQLVGLLPETRDLEPEAKSQMRSGGLGNLVERHESNIRAGWAKYGYGDA